MMNMKLLAVVTSPSIYHDSPLRRRYGREKFTGEEKFTLGEFTPVNMKNCGCRNIRKHRDIKNCDDYITLDI